MRYFCFKVIGLINDYTNIYSHNACMMFFHTNGYYNDFIYGMAFLYRLFFFNYFSMKRGYVYVWGTCKNV